MRSPQPDEATLGTLAPTRDPNREHGPQAYNEKAQRSIKIWLSDRISRYPACVPRPGSQLHYDQASLNI
jgi:hypothetical protein